MQVAVLLLISDGHSAFVGLWLTRYIFTIQFNILLTSHLMHTYIK